MTGQIHTKNHVKYTVNGLRLQANVASAVLTQIELECTCSVPILNGFSVGLNKERNKERKKTKTFDEILKAVPSALA